MSNTPSTTELQELGRLEDKIQVGVKSCHKAWAALKEIQTKGLHTARGFSTFDAYCKDVWGMGKSQAYNQIAASDTMARIESALPPSLADEIVSERQLRELKDVPQSDLLKVVTKAVTTASDEKKPRVTAAHIRKSASELSPKAKPKAKPAVKVQQAAPSTTVDTTALPPAKSCPSDEVFDKNKDKALEDLRMLAFHLSNIGLGDRWTQTIETIKSEVEAR